MSVNKAILLGHLGGDPDVRHMQDGTPVANFSLATTENWKDKVTGEKKSQTQWHRVVCWGEGLCNVIAQYLRKGSQVYIEGQIQTRKYTNQHGEEKSITEIVVRGFNGRLQMVGKRGDSGGHDDGHAPSAAPSRTPPQARREPPPDDDDGAPF